MELFPPLFAPPKEGQLPNKLTYSEFVHYSNKFIVELVPSPLKAFMLTDEYDNKEIWVCDKDDKVNRRPVNRTSCYPTQ
jgi:hypothetical protein